MPKKQQKPSSTEKCIDQNSSLPDLQLWSERERLDKNACKTSKTIPHQEKSKGELPLTNGFLNKLKSFFSRKKSSNENQNTNEKNEEYSQKLRKKYRRRRANSRKHKSKNKAQCKEVMSHQMEQNHLEIKPDTCSEVKIQKINCFEIENQSNSRSVAETENLKPEHDDVETKTGSNRGEQEEQKAYFLKLQNKIKHEFDKELKYFSSHLESIFNEKFEMFLKSYQEQRANRKKKREELAKHDKKNENSKDYTEKIINEVINRIINKNTSEMFRKRQRQLNSDTVLILSILPKAPNAIQTRNKKQLLKKLREKSLQYPPKTNQKDKEVTVILPPKKLRNTQIRPKIKMQTSHDSHQEELNSNIKVRDRHKAEPVYSKENLEKRRPQKNILSNPNLKNISEKSSLQIHESFLMPLPSLDDYSCQARIKSDSSNEKHSNFNRDGNCIITKDVKIRPNEDKQGKDSGIHIKSPISETSRIESMKHQTAIIAQAKSKSNIDSACGVFRDEVNIVCQSEPKSGIEDNIQKQFDEISKTIESIQCLYYASVETSPMLFNNDQSDKNKHFPGIFKTIENLKESVSNIRKPVETDASQSAGREKPVSATSAVAKETSNKANKTSPQKEAFSYLAKPQTPKASILQETISNIKRKNLLKHNVLYLRKSNCCEQNLETKTSNEVLEKISSVCIEPKNNSIASESSAFQKRKQYDRKLRRRMLKKSNKICSK